MAQDTERELNRILNPEPNNQTGELPRMDYTEEESEDISDSKSASSDSNSGSDSGSGSDSSGSIEYTAESPTEDHCSNGQAGN